MSMVNIGHESLADGFMAGNATIGMTEAKVSTVNFPIRKHIVIRAHADNDVGEEVIVGRPGDAVNGFRLPPGEETPPIYVDQTDKVAVVATAADQNYSWVAN
jgi:hypothetical protein